MTHRTATTPTRSGIAGWWYARRARAHGRYLRQHMLVAVPAERPAPRRPRHAAA